MLPPPALPVPSWFNSNDHIWSSSAGAAGSREDDQAETCQQSGFANEQQQQQLERHEAINLIRRGGGSLINAIGRRDSVSSSNLTETTSDNAQPPQALDLAEHDGIHKGRRGGLGFITAGQFEASSSERQDDQYHNIGQAGGGMRILDSSFPLQYGAGTASRQQQFLMNDYHQWQQQQQQLINPANLVALSSSNSANSSFSPFQQQQQHISGFACKLEPADHQLAVVDSMNNSLLADFHKNNSSSNHNKNLSGMTMQAQSNLTSASGEASVSSGSREEGAPAHPPSLQQQQQAPEATPCSQQPPIPIKKKRNLPGTPDPEAEVIALSPKTLLATNRFVCEICSKGFQRDQNLQLHRRGHNLPWKLRQRTSKEVRKRVYICPEVNCVHHDPARALGDLTGIKKHFCRKHGEKKWKCDKCSKRYAVQSDWKAHMKTCGTREYRCDCGTLFSRRDSFITHRAFCDALAEENSRVSAHTQVGGESVLSGSSADQMIPDHMMGSGGDHHRQLAHHGLGGFIQAGGRPQLQAAAAAAGGLHHLQQQQRPGQQQINSLINDSAANMISSLAAAQSKWDPSNPMGLKPLITPSPKLSLWLGNGPAGSGPQHGLISHQNDTNQLLHNLTGSPQMVSDHSSFFMQPPNSRSGNQLSCSNNMSSHNLPPNPFFNSDHNAMHGVHNSMGNNNNIAAAHNVDQGVLNQRISAGSVDHTFASPAHMMMNAGSSSNNNNNNNNSGVSLMSSMYNQGSGPHDPDQPQQQAQAAAANAQMSATALLQKAAMMGATASNSALFRSFNGSSMAPASSSSGADHSQDQHKLNMPTSASSMAGIMTNQQGIFMRPSSSSSGSHIMNGSAASHSAMNSIQGLLYSNSGLHPMDKNITGGGQSMSGIHADMISRYNNPGASNYNISQGTFVSLMQDKSAGMSRNQARMDQVEAGHDHKPTLDFLGIGGSSAAASGSHHIHPSDQSMSADNMMSIAAGPAPGMEFLSSSVLADHQKVNNLLVSHHKSLGSSSPERSPEYSS